MDLSTEPGTLGAYDRPVRQSPRSENGAVVISKSAALVALASACLAAAFEATAQGGVPRIRQRGALVCGVATGVAGFAQVDEKGRYKGFDVDICRALSAAIFSTPDKVRYEQASS